MFRYESVLKQCFFHLERFRSFLKNRKDKTHNGMKPKTSKRIRIAKIDVNRIFWGTFIKISNPNTFNKKKPLFRTNDKINCKIDSKSQTAQKTSTQKESIMSIIEETASQSFFRSFGSKANFVGPITWPIHVSFGFQEMARKQNKMGISTRLVRVSQRSIMYKGLLVESATFIVHRVQ